MSLSFIGSPAIAHLRVASVYVPEARLVGKARLSYLAWNVYDAELYAPLGRWDRNAPYALSINYLRTFTGEAIAKSSAEEIRKQGLNNEAVLSKWQRKMEQIFPDVSNGNNLMGVRDRNGHAIFFFNGRKIGSIRDREFTNRFFDIWLSQKTSRLGLRRKLIGASVN